MSSPRLPVEPKFDQPKILLGREGELCIDDLVKKAAEVEFQDQIKPQQVEKSALPSEFAEALTKLYGEPKGLFLDCADGVMNFQDDGPRTGKVVVCSHGIGTKMGIFDGPIHDELVNAGFRVISYSFYGHAWSYAKAELRYDKEMFLSQAKTLLDHLLKPEESVHMWIGHSTGGVVGALAANNGIGRRIERLALISPAFYANKPAIARLADKIPNVMAKLGRAVPTLISDGYIENADVAFAKEGGKHLFPERQRQAVEEYKHMFSLQPQVCQAIMGVSMGFLRSDLLPAWRQELKTVMEQADGPQLCLIWGTLDIVVPFDKTPELLKMNETRTTMKELPKLGHESPLEDPLLVANACVEFATAPGAHVC